MIAGLFSYFMPTWEQASGTRKRLLDSPIALAVSDAIRSERNYSEFVSQHFVQVGPTGSSGVIITVVPRNWPNPHRIGYYPDEQAWTDCGAYWLGRHRDVIPRAETLQRETLIRGYDVELGDGEIWQCPVIRWPNKTANLPRAMGVDAAGKYVETLRPQWDWAWKLASNIWDVYFLDKGGDVTDATMFDWGAQCLSINYRVGPQECTALGLLDTDIVARVLKAAVADPLIQEYLEAETSKKGVSAATP